MSNWSANLEKHRIPRKDIKPAPKDLSTATPIGTGGFGFIYKGQLSQDSGNRTVAIKRLIKKGSHDNIEFREELEMVSTFHHQNIVHFIGYCDDTTHDDDDDDDEMIIVFEYAENGDLDSHLNNSAKRARITWAQHMQICLGVARGLQYLQSGLVEHKMVIHRDVKSANILLDDKMEAKICDFGLSKIVLRDEPRAEIVTRIAGTNFYIDPLYHQTQILTKESDIYSFGVVMFEMLSGLMAYQQRSDVDGNTLCLMALVQRDSRKPLDNLIDPIIRDTINKDSLKTFKNVAHDCVSLEINRRPAPDIIIQKIQDALDIQEKYASGVASDKANTKILRILKLDPGLGPYIDHFEHRMMRFSEQKRLIDLYEGGLEEFAKGYLKFGFNREGGSIVYREWAPAAEDPQLVWDFKKGGESNYIKERSQFGVWTFTIPNVDGISAIPHNSKVKFRFKRNNGPWIDRVPAWIRFTKSTAPYDGLYWDPPEIERHKWKYPRPPKPHALNIYSVHVGMRRSEPGVNSYREFADNILPRVRDNKYNTLQLKAIMEHSHYGPSGCHVTSFFAVNSSAGTPQDLHHLIDEAHKLGLRVLIDVFHSHASSETTVHGLHGFDVGQPTQQSYFHSGDRGLHAVWGSKLFNYSNWEVLRFLLSNLRWWLEEFMVDGFCFKGVTSMLYDHHGINFGFTGDYKQYFSESTNVDALVYMMLANDLIHSLLPDATVIAEDISGMPGLGMRVDEGGCGFDFC